MLNTICIEGRLTDEPTLRFDRKNVPFCTFSIANDRDFDRETADFFDVIAFGKTAQFITDYFHKGSKILLRGRLSTSKWVDSHNQKRTDVKISVENAYFMESKRNANNMQKNENANFAYPNNPDFTDATSDDGEVPFL